MKKNCLLVLLCTLLFSCKDDDVYFVSAISDSVRCEVLGAGLYSESSTCSLTAKPSDNYIFEGWYDGDTKISEDLTYTFKVMSKKRFLARFNLKDQYVYVDIKENPACKVENDTIYTKGQSITLLAKVDSNFAFEGWYEDNIKISNDLSYTFIGNENKLLTPKVSSKTHVFINTRVVGTGKGVSIGGGVFPIGTEVIINYNPIDESKYYSLNPRYKIEGTNDFISFMGSKPWKVKIEENMEVRQYFGLRGENLSSSEIEYYFK